MVKVEMRSFRISFLSLDEKYILEKFRSLEMNAF